MESEKSASLQKTDDSIVFFVKEILTWNGCGEVFVRFNMAMINLCCKVCSEILNWTIPSIDNWMKLQGKLKFLAILHNGRSNRNLTQISRTSAGHWFHGEVVLANTK